MASPSKLARRELLEIAKAKRRAREARGGPAAAVRPAASTGLTATVRSLRDDQAVTQLLERELDAKSTEADRVRGLRLPAAGSVRHRAVANTAPPVAPAAAAAAAAAAFCCCCSLLLSDVCISVASGLRLAAGGAAAAGSGAGAPGPGE